MPWPLPLQDQLNPNFLSRSILARRRLRRSLLPHRVRGSGAGHRTVTGQMNPPSTIGSAWARTERSSLDTGERDEDRFVSGLFREAWAPHYEAFVIDPKIGDKGE